MRDLRARLENLERAHLPRVAGVWVLSRAGQMVVAHSRGKELERLDGESQEDFVDRFRKEFAPISGYIVVPFKEPIGASSTMGSPGGTGLPASVEVGGPDIQDDRGGPPGGGQQGTS